VHAPNGFFDGRLFVGAMAKVQIEVIYLQALQGLVAGFTKRYQVDRLVYFEETTDVRVAIEREKQLKTWRREKKLALIEVANPQWKDMYFDFTG
jgi:putative endonuclease